MKKLSLITILLLSSLAMYAYDLKIDGIYYTLLSNNTVEVTYSVNYNSYSGVVTIPQSVTYYKKTYTVTGIGYRAFYKSTGLTSVSVPNTVTSIGSSAFEDCSRLETVTIIGDSLTSIGNYAFNGCTKLTSINIPGSVTTIGISMFADCSALTSFVIGDSVTTIGKYAFYGCKKLESIVIPNAVTSIGDYAFSNCSGLTTATIGSSLTSIGKSLFACCGSLKSVNIPNSVTSIGDYAFERCSNLTSVAIPNTVTTIGNYTFQWCENLTSVNIPDSITSIGVCTFYNCEKLTSIIIPNSVVQIGYEAFRWCSSLMSIDIPNSVTTIGTNAFYGCSGLSSLTIPKSVTMIGVSAFYKCSGIERIVDFSKASFGGTSDSDYSKVIDSSVLKKIYCYSGRKYTDTCSLIYFENLVTADIKQEKICSIDFSISTEQDIPEGIAISDITISDGNGKLVNPSLNLYHVDTHTANIAFKFNDEILTHVVESSKKPEIEISVANRTQTTVTIKATVTTDETCPIKSLSVNNREVANNGTVKFENFYPGYASGYEGCLVTDYGTQYHTVTASTLPLTIDYTILNTTPNAIDIKVTWDEGDAVIKDYGFYTTAYVYDKTTEYYDDGLLPSHSYSFSYGVDVKYNGSKIKRYTKSFSVKTSDLEWGDNTPVATSLTSARLMSKTNCTASSGTGFEWKRYDAPDELSPNKSYCPVVDGIIVGSLRNLNSEVYYKYRPFYTSSSDVTYYGNWTVFFTGDANVYFEPEVRTYSDIVLSEQTATVKGYVLPGSDEIIEQGFEYRRIGASNSRASDVWTAVKSSGVLMTADLTDLEYSSTYVVRTYAKTSSATFYGEQLQFSTSNSSGVYNMIVDHQSNSGITTALRENPATSTAWLKVEGAQTERVQVYIVSISGAIIANTQVDANGEWQPVELNIKQGTYLLLTSDGTSRSTLRLIVR